MASREKKKDQPAPSAEAEIKPPTAAPASGTAFSSNGPLPAVGSTAPATGAPTASQQAFDGAASKEAEAEDLVGHEATHVVQQGATKPPGR